MAVLPEREYGGGGIGGVGGVGGGDSIGSGGGGFIAVVVQACVYAFLQYFLHNQILIHILNRWGFFYCNIN